MNDHIPVILLTAKSTTAEQVEGLGHGADLYLTKPFSQHVLQLSVRNMLSQKEKLRQKLNRDLAFLTLGGENKTAEVADTSFLHKLADEIRANLDDPHFNVDVLARKVGMSTPVLYKKVKA
ncbi:response regulator [Leadbetterella byssophila]|uniref:response regulator n=1 Tax=Leadbetterella byssophila TaxID=316068 RepID=UPI00030614F5|nr:response regulator [Leadbetterella byssophila]